MDLKTERKIKFWLTTISKILVMALVVFKLIDYLFDEKDTTTPDKDTLTTNFDEKPPQDSLQEKDDVVLKQEPTAIQKSKDVSENKKSTTSTIKPVSPVNAKLQLVKDSFIWLKDQGKFVLKLANTTAGIAEHVTVNTVLIFDKEENTIPLKQNTSINANGTLNLDFATSNLSYTTLPNTIMLCFNHESKAAKQKHWYKYVLGNKVSGSGAIETRSVYYKTLSFSSGTFTNSPPSCIVKTKTSGAVSTDAKKAEDITLKNIKSTAQLFIRGLNNKSLITVKNTTTPQLYTLLTNLEASTYGYGFSNAVEVLSVTNNTAIVKLTLSESGRSNYIQQQAAYNDDTGSRKASDFFTFLNRKGSGWEGKLINQNGIWKFDVF